MTAMIFGISLQHGEAVRADQEDHAGIRIQHQ